MAIDLKKTFSTQTLTRPLSAGTVVEQEGLILVHRLEDGVEKVHLAATVAATDVPVGYAVTADSLPSRTAAVEVVTAPAAPASLEADLRNQNLVLNNIRAVSSNGTVLTIDPVYAGAPADNAVKVDLPTGRVKFHADEAGTDVTFTYLYDLTMVQAKQKFGQRFVNNWGLHAEHGFIEVGHGHAELYTDQYDASVDWATAATIQLGDAGQIVAAGVGPTLNAIVISVPSVDNALLGLRIQFG
jgi:hypothetical protein